MTNASDKTCDLFLSGCDREGIVSEQGVQYLPCFAFCSVDGVTYTQYWLFMVIILLTLTLTFTPTIKLIVIVALKITLKFIFLPNDAILG